MSVPVSALLLDVVPSPVFQLRVAPGLDWITAGYILIKLYGHNTGDPSPFLQNAWQLLRRRYMEL